MKRKYLFMLLVGLILALGMVGLGCEMCCNSSQGSGSIAITDESAGGSHKATFSYRVECVGSYADPTVDPSATWKVKGRLEYQDHNPWKRNGLSKAANVSIHGIVDGVVLVEDGVCSQNQNVAIFKGQYVPQPRALGDGGEFTVKVVDKGKPGPSSEDTFEMKLCNGVFADYEVHGVLAGGNLKAL